MIQPTNIADVTLNSKYEIYSFVEYAYQADSETKNPLKNLLWDQLANWK